MDEGPDFLRNQSDGLLPRGQGSADMSGELEKLRGFIRFSEYSGVWERKSSQKSSPPSAAKPLLQSLCQRILFYLRQYTQGPTAIQQRPFPE